MKIKRRNPRNCTASITILLKMKGIYKDYGRGKYILESVEI